MACDTCKIDGCGGSIKAAGYCSKHYQRAWKYGDPLFTHRPDLTNEERLAAGVDKRGVDECWEYKKSRHTFGYGRVALGKRGAWAFAHRLAWELANGPIPDGMEVCHSCDNPPCVNERHLFLGTHADNIRDMYAKGRDNSPFVPGHTLSPSGDNHWTRRAKLTV